MLVIGLTGGIGAGKSTVADLFAKRGVPIIDTDEVAREVVLPETNAWSAIYHRFGAEILFVDKQINRPALRKLIFENPAEREWLEHLLHPLIRQEVDKQVAILTAPYCIVVIPLLAETKPNPIIQRILLVDTPEHLQVQRVMERDASAKEHVEAIMQRQAKRHERQSLADDIIVNDHDLRHLEAQVEKLHQLYLSLC